MGEMDGVLCQVLGFFFIPWFASKIYFQQHWLSRLTNRLVLKEGLSQWTEMLPTLLLKTPWRREKGCLGLLHEIIDVVWQSEFYQIHLEQCPSEAVFSRSEYSKTNPHPLSRESGEQCPVMRRSQEQH